MSARGTTNTNARGSAASRRIRKNWLLAAFGDGFTAPCFYCHFELDFFTVTADRIIPGVVGGSYARGNIRPCCLSCNSIEGTKFRELMRALRLGRIELVLA